ncbi:MAG: serine O-acetyltransferase EpsC [Spirochaetota bacterium]
MNDEERKPFSYIEEIVNGYDTASGSNFIDERRLPDVKAITSVLEKLLEILFPGYSGTREVTSDNLLFVIGDLVCTVRYELIRQVAMAYRHECSEKTCSSTLCDERAETAVDALLGELPSIRRILKIDVTAAYNGDPAAASEEEVVICYPGIKALAIHRLSHILYQQKVPLIPRMMNEIAHSQTGIDIHPGAKIGEGLFIDHGTGVVIGETAEIGKQVKIYQGVTLGALSFPKDQRGNLLKGAKRHPTIHDNVTIYAHTTILGNVTIEKGVVIGSNVWLKEGVDAHTLVTREEQPVRFKRYTPTS